eukprot:5968995-Alexandrium_andersonii.AAC.1
MQCVRPACDAASHASIRALAPLRLPLVLLRHAGETRTIVPQKESTAWHNQRLRQQEAMSVSTPLRI